MMAEYSNSDLDEDSYLRNYQTLNDEPKLSYERILNDLATVIGTDSITSSCLHNKLFAIGTLYGRIHLFDHQGNKVYRQELCYHLKSVKSISIDDKGEYLVSCSSDRLVVYGLFNAEHNFVLMTEKPMNHVAIDPHFGAGRKFVAGDDKVVLYERGFLGRYKSTVLQSKEQKIRTLSWHGQFIAWATDVAVQIYDVEQRAIITRIKRENHHNQEPCRFCWKDKLTLLIGWSNSVKVCLIKERSHDVPKELPTKYVEIISMFETDFIIYGLAPFNDTLLTLTTNQPKLHETFQDSQSYCDSSTASIRSSTPSIDATQSDNSDALIRPQVNIIETFASSYNELSKDLLTPEDCSNANSKSYNLLSLHDDGIYFIVCPNDVISAKPRDYNDSLQTMTDQVIKSLAKDPKNLVLNEALADLYTRMGKVEEAVNIYLDYNVKTRIFSLIRNNNLVTILRERVDKLMQLDAGEASQLLVENIESIPMKEVIDQLQEYKSKRYLTAYLHRLVLKDPNSCNEYHNLMVKLYAQHQRESLLNFLKSSTNYSLEEALTICMEANLIKEVVYLYSRMGNLQVALKYITESQGDINEAIEFCKEHQDPELWQDLILYSMNKPEFIGVLLKNIGTHVDDPIELIDRIPNGCQIEGLMPALVKILQDHQLQISLEQSCRDLMAKDCFSLLEKQIRSQTQGIAIKEDQLCDHCNQPLFSDVLVGAQSGLNDLVVFGCHHVFHADCCMKHMSGDETVEETDLTNLEDSSPKTPTCRVCAVSS